MSDIFEEDIDDGINLSSLEDKEVYNQVEDFEFDTPLYVLKLDYSFESLYAKNEKNDTFN